MLTVFSQKLNLLSLSINKIMKIFLGIIVFTMFGSLFSQVCFRYFLNSPLSWPEEFTMFLMAWMSFTGSSVALRDWGHIGIDFLLEKTQGIVKLYLLLLIRLIVFMFCIVLFKEGLVLVQESIGIVSDGMRVSMVYPRLSIPFGTFIMIFHIVAMIFSDLNAIMTFKK